jgi:phosphopantothenoylcysteine decarboxylase / phosphopantothenate---cysteine ligase
MRSLVRSASKKPLGVLITSGPTSVPIDDMRVITNRSTGEMGRLIANAFLKIGARVTLLEGAVTTTIPVKPSRLRKFYTYSELDVLLKKELGQRCDVIIHAAAVSDFIPKKTFKGKLGSGDKMTLELVPAKKLVLTIKKEQPKTWLIGFKFEPSINKAGIIPKVASLFDQAGCSMVVVNKSDVKGYEAYIMHKDHSTTGAVNSKKALVTMLIKECLKKI